MLWLFGDTHRTSSEGNTEFFVIGTGAWAAAEEPTLTLDHLVGGEPLPLATPPEGAPECPPDTPSPGMWPASVVVVPHGAVDRVLIWLANVCLGHGGLLEVQGMALGEWWYEPRQQGGRGAVELTVLEPQLFSSTGSSDPDEPLFGAAAVVGEDGLIYAYSCRTAGEVHMDSGDACYLARVSAEGASDADAYAVWDGERFTLDRRRAAPLDLPAGDGYRPVPPGQVSVAWHAGRRTYVMGYSPWPGRTEVINIRVAEEPWGPWSKPATVHLPGCDDRSDGRIHACMTASLQGFMDTTETLGVGYYDSLVDPRSGSGASFVAEVPFVRSGADPGGSQPE